MINDGHADVPKVSRGFCGFIGKFMFRRRQLVMQVIYKEYYLLKLEMYDKLLHIQFQTRLSKRTSKQNLLMVALALHMEV